jgi:chromosome partitioning protein
MSADDDAFRTQGLSIQTIERIDAGENQPNLDTLEKYARALNLTIALRSDEASTTLRLALPKQRVFAIYNHAGGVGKTSLTRDLGFAISQVGYRVLLIDLDPQSNLTSWLGIPRPVDIERTAYSTIMGEQREPTLPEGYRIHGMDIIPSTIRLNRIDRGSIQGRRRRLQRALANANYDVVLIDMNPSITNLTEIGLAAANGLIVPMPTSEKGLDAFPGILESLEEARDELNSELSITMFVLTQYNGNTAVDQEMREQVETYARPIAPVVGPLSSSVIYREAMTSGKPIALYDPTHMAVQQISRVATQLLDIMHRTENGETHAE